MPDNLMFSQRFEHWPHFRCKYLTTLVYAITVLLVRMLCLAIYHVVYLYLYTNYQTLLGYCLSIWDAQDRPLLTCSERHMA